MQPITRAMPPRQSPYVGCRTHAGPARGRSTAARRAAAAVPLQPLAQQVRRLEAALGYLGQPLPPADRLAINDAIAMSDEPAAVARLQQVLDRHVLASVHISPESRVKVEPGSARPELVQGGTRLFLVKVINEAGVTAPLTVQSPNSGRVYVQGRGSARAAEWCSPTRTSGSAGRSCRSTPSPRCGRGCPGSASNTRSCRSTAATRGSGPRSSASTSARARRTSASATTSTCSSRPCRRIPCACACWTSTASRRPPRFSFATTRPGSIRTSRSGSRRISSFSRRSTAPTARRLTSRRAPSRSTCRAVPNTCRRPSVCRCRDRRRCSSGWRAGSIRRATAGTRAIITSTRPAARTTKTRPRACCRRTCGRRSTARRSTSRAC